jgi:hypothetical protein
MNMKHVTNILLFGLLTLSLLWSGLSTLYAQELSRELTCLRRDNRSDTVYLRNRVKELEAEIKEHIRLPLQPVGGNASHDWNTDVEETRREEETDTSEATGEDTQKNSDPVTEEVTIPVQNSPETVPSEDIPTVESTPSALYVVAEHRGILGVFAPTGELIRTVNVLVATLTSADREALQLGIPAYSEQELIKILEAYN